jgi:hypothetical protein
MHKRIRINNEQCSYKCPYFLNGPVISICCVKGDHLKYDKGKPLITEECKGELKLTGKEH